MAGSWVSVRLVSPTTDRPVTIAAAPEAWLTFARHATPTERLAAWDALEAWEHRLRDGGSP